MHDNGLVEYYKSLPSKNGFLDLSEKSTVKKFSVLHGASKKIIDGKSFYVKSTYNKQASDNKKYEYDAEILLSQIYAKAGLETTIYTPATSKDTNFLISNDISSPKTILASTHMFPLQGVKVRGVTRLRPYPFLARNKNTLAVKPNLLLAKRAMQEQTIMRILDVASFNADRHYMNFFYKLSSPVRTKKDLPAKNAEGTSISYGEFRPEYNQGNNGFSFSKLLCAMGSSDIMGYYRSHKVEGVVAIDYGSSGFAVSKMARGDTEYGDKLEYASDFCDEALYSSEFKSEITESETLGRLIDKGGVAEMIGSLDPKSVAEDIKQTIGYTVDSTMVDMLSRSYDNMAETLIQ